MAWRELLCRFRTLRMLFIIVACFTFIRISKVLSSAGRPQLDQELTSGDLGPQKDILPHNHRDFASIRRRHKKFPNPMQLVKDLHPIMAVQQIDVSLHKAEGWKATEQPTKITFYDNTIVHFDLKGAAPKVAYLKEVFKWVKQ
ncbi:hypothetical protein Tcan_06568 [Toxocara canis]|uniref:Uncharacterized protein n=1 Tax=Toxocara canis TaxID=6265 RepID=A0A0B2V1I2_TOXCA|nr:hypothetical protein Tcan_06568 [Toxocara canis]